MHSFWTHGIQSATGHEPDDLQQAVRYDEHLPSDFTFAADEVAWSKDVRPHLQHKVVKKFRFALVKYRHLLPIDNNSHGLSALHSAYGLTVGALLMKVVSTVHVNLCFKVCSSIIMVIFVLFNIHVYVIDYTM